MVTMRNLWKRHKFLLIGIPCILVLAAALVVFFLYGRGRQLEIRVEEGNRCLTELDYNQAVVHYKQALEIDEKNDEANLGLAEAYQGLGQDSYAEGVYQNMLEYNDRQAEVYRLLAELYFQQDKLEEARQLLETAQSKVEDEEITVLYRITRPEPPSASYEAGEYQDRIAVELIPADEEQTIYYTMDGSDPTEESAIYGEPLILRNGETVIKAMAVNATGYQSDIAVYEYDLQIRNVEVTLEEPVIERIIRDRLELSYDEPIYNEDIEQITELYIVGDAVGTASDEYSVNLREDSYLVNGSEYSVSGRGQIETLDDLQYMPFLKRAAVIYQEDLDISILDQCDNITELSLAADGLTDRDLDVIGRMQQLEQLNLGWNRISDVSALGELTGLSVLSLWGNQISSIDALESLENLQYLDFSDNQVEDISSVAGMEQLSELWMYENQVRNLESLRELSNLRVLMLKGNPIEDVESVEIIYPRLERIDEDLLDLGGERK